MNSTLIAHVADSIERISGGDVEDYDATADFAASLLTEDAGLEAVARCYSDGALSDADFDAIVKTAADKYGE